MASRPALLFYYDRGPFVAQLMNAGEGYQQRSLEREAEHVSCCVLHARDHDCVVLLCLLQSVGGCIRQYPDTHWQTSYYSAGRCPATVGAVEQDSERDPSQVFAPCVSVCVWYGEFVVRVSRARARLWM